MNDLTIQNDLRPAIPYIFDNIDYQNFRDTLIKIDEILRKGKLEDQLIEAAIDRWSILAEEDISSFMNTAS